MYTITAFVDVGKPTKAMLSYICTLPTGGRAHKIPAVEVWIPTPLLGRLYGDRYQIPKWMVNHDTHLIAGGTSNGHPIGRKVTRG